MWEIIRDKEEYNTYLVRKGDAVPERQFHLLHKKEAENLRDLLNAWDEWFNFAQKMNLNINVNE